MIQNKNQYCRNRTWLAPVIFRKCSRMPRSKYDLMVKEDRLCSKRFALLAKWVVSFLVVIKGVIVVLATSRHAPKMAYYADIVLLFTAFGFCA